MPDAPAAYPARAYLNFYPGGIIYDGATDDDYYDLATFSTQNNANKVPETLVSKARAADDSLRQHVDPSSPYFLPSLSILAGAVFGRLTGVPPNSAKAWADAMVLHASLNPQDLKPNDTCVTVLKRMLEQQSSPTDATRRPCGYVFKRGDIAWNCRTCQTDATCVICDNCFRDSNHDGHEVYFHRTTPGGCCDCGDAEAWALDGCCSLHRPDVSPSASTSEDDAEEAVRTMFKGQQDGAKTLTESPTALPPKMAAALGVVVGAVVHCLVQAVDGAGIGADPAQWKLRWADEACRVANGVAHDEEYCLKQEGYTGETPTAITSFVQTYRLQLRLHNDDVHTFDEVIEALHEPRHARRSSEDHSPSLVPLREDADEMTHHVDADGQVLVKSYPSMHSAFQGFRRLKARGLHCAVVGTAQVDMEQRARALTTWLGELCAAHPAAAALIVHALVQVSPHHDLAGISVWHEPRIIPSWASGPNRLHAFPPQQASSYLTRDEAERLHRMALEVNVAQFVELTGADPNFYNNVPYRLPSERYRKSPHALWGTLPSVYSDTLAMGDRHPLLHRLVHGQLNPLARNRLTESVLVVDTDLRKEQEINRIIASVYPHKLPGLHMISGIGTLPLRLVDRSPPALPNPMEFRHLLETCSFRAPVSPIVLMLLLDPYPTKQLRSSLHALFLSLLIDSRFKCRFAAALGGIAYRPLSTLFCAGVGTDADTPLGFTVQIFTAGSLIRALGNAGATEKLLRSDYDNDDPEPGAPVGIFTMPIAHSIVRCIHTNLLGSTKEVQMILKNTAAGNDEESNDDTELSNANLLPALSYVAGEHPLVTPLPAGHDDGYLDSRSTRHKRLPHVLRDLEYVIETPGTAIRLLLPNKFPMNPELSAALKSEDTPNSNVELLTFAAVWSRLLRIAQGMDLQKRKISGGHVEYEQSRWLEAFGLSLNFAGTRDALAESLTNSSSATVAPVSEDGSHLDSIREAMGNLFAALLREMKYWLYFEGVLETGLPLPPGGTHGGTDLSQVEALQRSTLHFSGSQLTATLPDEGSQAMGNSASAVALSCATGVKMTESQLGLIESALRNMHRQTMVTAGGHIPTDRETPLSGPEMGDWLRVPHSPLAGDSLSFHLPLHRALAKSIRSMCCVVVPESIRKANPTSWWNLPVIDEDYSSLATEASSGTQHPLAVLIRSTLRSANCRVVWSAGPDCSPAEAHWRRSRAKTVSANIAIAKIIHSIADHPLRCLAAAQQIERHLWARNGGSVAGMALNYSSAPLCRSFRDLDLTLLQLSSAGRSIGLGASRIFSLLMSRFNMDGYLCDPERRAQAGSPTHSGSAGFGAGTGGWVKPPRLQDPEHAVALSETFFTTLCLLVTELPAPPPVSQADDTALKQCIRRELLHALAAEPRSHSEAMEAATSAANRRDENVGITGTSGGGGALGDVFAAVLRDIGKQKNHGSSRAASGPPAYELRADCCDEYDPTFFHLRRQEHQHAMDTVARLRRQKVENKTDAVSLPIVCPPPKAHPRFLPCRLLLHLQPMDAAIRRALLFALTGGMWLPPEEPQPPSDEKMEEGSDEGDTGVVTSTMSPLSGGSDAPSIPVTTFGRRAYPRTLSSGSRRSSFNEIGDPEPFSSAVVAASSVSFIEVLQLLTLQVHTLEECASLHRTQPDLDSEAKSLSSGLSINSYLGRLASVPESLVDVWALKPAPDGPLPSKGSGENRGSILGLLVALYEHRSDHGAGTSNAAESAHGDDGHGGARLLAASGLKWLLRFVHSLVDGATSVSSAVKSAATGVRVTAASSTLTSDWTIHPSIRLTIRNMLNDLDDLWPTDDKGEEIGSTETATAKSREEGKAAQLRWTEMMKKKQAAFAATIAPSEKSNEQTSSADLCIICRCDDADGELNGPLGYLGHVQRSRGAQIRIAREASKSEFPLAGSNELFQKFRVIGHRGCQLRANEAMDSEQLVCLPTGSIVSVLGGTISDKYDIRSRRVLVRHNSVDAATGVTKTTEGWASLQSSEGYVILSPLSAMCFSHTRWGNTRPVIRQCGHAAHLKCVETHTLSLHQRAAGEQPYDGRFAANIDDGEFLCPLCKQLSNILIPRDASAQTLPAQPDPRGKPGASAETMRGQLPVSSLRSFMRITAAMKLDDTSTNAGKNALQQFGDHLLQAMDVPWERATPAKKERHRRWHPSIQRWDYEDEEDTSDNASPCVRNILRLLRQQHIAWASVGHSAAAAEAAARGVEEVLPFGVFSKTSDPWVDFDSKSSDSHPMLLELKRTLNASSGLLEALLLEMTKVLSTATADVSSHPVVGSLLMDILEGRSWIINAASIKAGNESELEKFHHWSQLSGLVASMPCHVSRDALSQRHEARAAAAAMWTVKGIGTQRKNTQGDSNDSSTISLEPPVPYAIKQIQASSAAQTVPIPRNWGTMEPFAVEGHASGEQAASVPFRPGIASSFLYVPLLAWDLNTFAGAMFSTMLSNAAPNLPSATDLLLTARTILVARMIQSAITPCGYELSPETDEDEYLEYWNADDLEKEASALVAIVSHCQIVARSRSLEIKNTTLGRSDHSGAMQLFGALGRAILPLARSLILLLRASTSTLRQRQEGLPQKDGIESLRPLLENEEIMSTEDGFMILKEMGGPLPSEFIADSPSVIEGNSLWALMNRWMLATVGLELHHGSRGNSIIPQLSGSLAAAPLKKRPSETNSDTPMTDGASNELTISDAAERVRAAVTPSEAHQNGGTAAMETDVDHDNEEEGEDDESISENEEANEDEEEEEMAVEEERMRETARGLVQFLNDHDFVADNQDDSEDEMMQDAEMEDADEMMLRDTLFGTNRGSSQAPPDGFEDTSDDSSSNSVSDDSEHALDRKFAHVSQSPIISYQPSLLAVERVGEGQKGAPFEFDLASSVMCDLSHLGMIHIKDPTKSLIRLPTSFVELYSLVNKVRGRDDASHMDDSDDLGSSETAICLLTGSVMRSGSPRRSYSRTARPPGYCTQHARQVGSGIGIFFLVQKCTVLLMHNNKSAYSASLYVDQNGEEDPNLRRGRPLFLNEARYRALETLWRHQGIPREVAQIRSTADRVIRDNWY